MTVQELWKEGNHILSEAGIEEAILDSRYLLEWVLQCNHSYLLLNPNSLVTMEQEQQYRTAILERKGHKPLQYIVGEQEFMGYSFLVNEHVLIPRQDTEILVETVLKHMQECMETASDCEKLQEDTEADTVYKILDMCCGSGCIGISLWKKINEKQQGMCQVIVSDISSEALEVTRENAKRLKADVEIIKSDLFQAIKGKFHILVSNPPYIPSKVVDTLMPEVREHEPRLALDGSPDGLFFYRNIIEQAKDYLEEEGYVFFEIGFDQAEDVRKIFVDAGFEQVMIKQDLAGLDRVIYAKLPAGKNHATSKQR
ncbi:MAG: peptide chain release factor N(5)-glutamine methyltransferase [Lachnospiraceae bacterium]|nr:peptide chain release factor N(5)-glutamine methyltransferase [Lachnospiraceae bacterium]